MTKHTTRLNTSNLESYLDQITKKNTTNVTKSKLNFRAANFLMRLGGLKNLRRALELFNNAYNLTSQTHGENHTRCYNIVIFIIKCEKLIDKEILNKKNRKSNN